MMTNSVQFHGWISWVRRPEAISAILVLTMSMVAPAMLAAQSPKAPPDVEQILYNFCALQNCSDGAAPAAGLVQDAAGNFYGATGNNVYKLTKDGKETNLHTFTGGTDGGICRAGLLRDSSGNLYGTTGTGGDLKCNGDSGCGVVFKVDMAGNETVLYSFKGAPDGMYSVAGLIRDSEGNFYGTTYYGGDLNCDPEYGYGTETVLYAFHGDTDSEYPMAVLVIDAKGNLYGTTYGNGSANPGTVFKVTPSGKETVLYTFRGGNDGEQPMAGLIVDGKGNLYGTTSGGGNTMGTVFKVSPKGNETVLHNFFGGYDGADPEAALIMDAEENLYGTTRQGGPLGEGTAFKLEKNGIERILRRFANGEGAYPVANLLQDSKGNLYGTTEAGGLYDAGLVFKLIP
jgi:uncharacterized repeat protein (TIGR03803 family)